MSPGAPLNPLVAGRMLSATSDGYRLGGLSRSNPIIEPPKKAPPVKGGAKVHLALARIRCREVAAQRVGGQPSTKIRKMIE
jgi:hypothetical protein